MRCGFTVHGALHHKDGSGSGNAVLDRGLCSRFRTVRSERRLREPNHASGSLMCRAAVRVACRRRERRGRVTAGSQTGLVLWTTHGCCRLCLSWGRCQTRIARYTGTCFGGGTVGILIAIITRVERGVIIHPANRCFLAVRELQRFLLPDDDVACIDEPLNCWARRRDWRVKVVPCLVSIERFDAGEVEDVFNG